MLCPNWGFRHNMERTVPLHNDTAVPGADLARPYHNARAPVYIVSGAVGCAEQHDAMADPWHPWSAWRSEAYGYSHLTVHNSTHLEFDFQSDNLGGAVIDSFTITKDTPCSFGSACSPAVVGASASKGALADEDSGTAKYRTMAARRADRIIDLRECWARESQATQTPKQRTAPSVCSAVHTQTGPAGDTGTPLRGLAGHDAAASTVPVAQREALVELYEASNGAEWRRNENWLRGDPCDPAARWYGVGCARITDTTLPDIGAGAGFGITAIQLAANNLDGTIPATVAQAFSDTLQLLDLADNSLAGGVPVALLAMPRLHSLFMYGKGTGDVSMLEGGLPDPICTRQLRYLHLQRQNMTGGIPRSISQCTGLNQLMLTSNLFSGLIPHSLTTLPLTIVHLEDNNFSCPMPCFRKYAPCKDATARLPWLLRPTCAPLSRH